VRHGRSLSLLVAAAVGALAWAPGGAGAAVPPVGADVRLNEIQTIGTHNSYHVEPVAAEKTLRAAAAPARAADPAKGAALYGTHCAVCHGTNGTPVMPGAPNFRRLESLMRPDQQPLMAIRNGKGAMPGYFGILRDREILDVVAYLRTLS